MPDIKSAFGSLETGGHPLHISVRNYFEPGFGYDFSGVRVHTSSRAGELAHTLQAKAFTINRDIVFGKGEYTPTTAEGKRLLGHELAHVVQQSGGAPAIQRAPKNEPRRDVVVITSPDIGSDAPLLAPGVAPIRVTSLDEMAGALKKIDFPIRRLFIISHSLPSGDLGFGNAATEKYELPSKIASKLKGTLKSGNAPDVVDFRGCTIGQDPKAMDEIRAALGAGSAIGGNCYLVTQTNGPIALNGVRITKASQVTEKLQSSFDAGLKKLIDSFGPAKDCILDTSQSSYFRAGSRMVAVWYSPDLDTKWNDRESVCHSKLKPEKVDPAKSGSLEPGLGMHCRLIMVEKGAP
jgi:hypothetical protein